MPSPKRIGKIEFGLLSPKEIRTMSVRKIIWADTYDDDGFPYPQGHSAKFKARLPKVD